MNDNQTSSPIPLQTFTSGKDLGVTTDNLLNFHEHSAKTVCKANSTLGLFKRLLTSQPHRIFLKLYKAIVRPVLDFGTCFAGPFYKGDIKLIEGVQRRATKCISGLGEKPYGERLSNLKLPFLTFQCKWSDMPLTYKFVNQPQNKLLNQLPNKRQT